MDAKFAPFMVPIVITIGSFLFVLALRYIKHTERMKMIERGIAPQDMEDIKLPKSQNPLGFSFMIIGASIGLLSSIFLTRMFNGFLSDDESTGVYFALIGLGVGIGRLLAMRFENR
jgi:hypothetical protein